MKTFSNSVAIKSWDELPISVSRELDLIYRRSINQVRVADDILYVGFNTRKEVDAFVRKNGGSIISTENFMNTRIPYFVELLGWVHEYV